MRRVLFVCVALGLAGMLRAQTGSAVRVLRGGTLVDVASGEEIPDSVIVIRGERIEQVDAGGSTGIPEGALIVEAHGKWIVPGLIDSHAHAEDDEDRLLSLYLANGVTTIRNPGGNITAQRLTRDQLARGELVGPRLFFSGHKQQKFVGMCNQAGVRIIAGTDGPGIGAGCCRDSGYIGNRNCWWSLG
jgi:imidazolonepropionase-like amidohydrolase